MSTFRGIFQSTLPQGERHKQGWQKLLHLGISIHAPTRGATVNRFYKEVFFIFQSTLPQGERRMEMIFIMCLIDFNPRSHKGSDGGNGGKYVYYLHFNPRSHKGSDITIPQEYADSIISIHAPTRGATISGFQCLPSIRISIHAPTRGATA